jgi:hypothetical protein
MRSAVSRLVVMVAVVAVVVSGGPVSAEPEPDRVCVFGGYGPHVHFDECVDVPSYPDWFPDPSIPEIGYFVPRIP